MSRNSSIVKEQADVIAVLEERLNRQAPPNSNGLKSDKKQIQELEAEVESLKVCMSDIQTAASLLPSEMMINMLSSLIC